MEDILESDSTYTVENVGKGLAFLGVVLFVAYAFLFLFSMAMPQLFNLFSGPVHFVIVSIVSLSLIIGGWVLTKR
jgi:protein-S-isoprenylcysteine O-methyltransferase Ste14